MSDDGYPSRTDERMRSQRISNQPYDEAVSIDSDEGSGDAGDSPDHIERPRAAHGREPADSEAGDRIMRRSLGGTLGGDMDDTTGGARANLGLMMLEEEGLHEPRGGDEPAATLSRVDYKDLNVSSEIRDLFEYIDRYQPEVYQIETVLKPFIPEYIASIGDIDGFLKISRPDNKEDGLALAVVDEPAAKQSDPTVLNLQLRANSRKANVGPLAVKSVDPEAEPRELTSWIANITDMHSKKPLPAVHYTRAMPDIEALMQEWPPEFESALQAMPLPSADIDLDLATYARVVCLLLDIPVHETSTIESLHVLFTLYLEAKAHQGVQIDG
eukprot:c46105_g1_i1.p1 GENE.c46105_g1_i1~~c46105_g1_i1.p1  ORF type:complete len:328 (-),score=55.34 c46105_g1_i1:16-999(-)